jgi:hypothetical protein
MRHFECNMLNSVVPSTVVLRMPLIALENFIMYWCSESFKSYARTSWMKTTLAVKQNQKKGIYVSHSTYGLRVSRQLVWIFLAFRIWRLCAPLNVYRLLGGTCLDLQGRTQIYFYLLLADFFRNLFLDPKDEASLFYNYVIWCHVCIVFVGINIDWTKMITHTLCDVGCQRILFYFLLKKLYIFYLACIRFRLSLYNRWNYWVSSVWVST